MSLTVVYVMIIITINTQHIQRNSKGSQITNIYMYTCTLIYCHATEKNSRKTSHTSITLKAVFSQSMSLCHIFISSTFSINVF